MKNKITPDIQAQIYAMVAWNGKTMEEAESIVDDLFEKNGKDAKKVYAELDKSVYANDSIIASLDGITKRMDELKGPNKYDAIVDIIVNIHNKWVEGNTKKYDRGNPEKSKKQIFQHLPTELIGIDEVAKDLMFLAPFLKTLGIDAGKMGKEAYGAFVPSPEIKEAYNRKVEKFKQSHDIETKEDLRDAMPEIIDEYKPLHNGHELSQARLDYMKENMDTLTDAVVAKQDKDMFLDSENGI